MMMIDTGARCAASKVAFHNRLGHHVAPISDTSANNNINR
jgi:hypothetical protein